MKKFNVSLTVEKDLEVKVMANNAADAVIKAAQLYVRNNEDEDVKTVAAYTENENANGQLETTSIVVNDYNDFEPKCVTRRTDLVDEIDDEIYDDDEDDAYDEESFFEESLKKMFVEICEHCPHSEGCKRKEQLE